MSEHVARGIREVIEHHGPIGFDRFMELALYGPGGFYEEPPVGPEGDFVTSPHVHPVFARLLGAGIRELHGLLGHPEPLRLTEVGAGDGTLATGLLEPLADLDVVYTAVEQSVGAREKLRDLPEISVTEQLEGAGHHVVLANELLDNLPFRLFRDGMEVHIDVDIDVEGGRFVERLVEPREESDPDLRRLIEAATSSRAEGVVPVGALAFIDEVAARLADPGYVLLIDYGAVGEPGGPPHGYRAHRIVEDLLEDPGSTDITSGVDLTLVARRAESHGLTAFPPVTQRHALTALGFETWIRDERARQTEALSDRRSLEAVRTWSGRSRATLLVDATALGRMQWLVLATQGLPAPSFIA